MGCKRYYGCFNEWIPLYEVRIQKSFGVGKYEVTIAERDACVSAGGCIGYRLQAPGFHRRSNRSKSPVVYVNYDDAQACVLWSSEFTEEKYRLHSEAVWEYEARAGSISKYLCGDNWKYTVPVGSFRPNHDGLYDVLGNVQELVEDCWSDSHDGAPSDGSPWLSDDCRRSIARRGSFTSVALFMTVFYRNDLTPKSRNSRTGFRVARTFDW